MVQPPHRRGGRGHAPGDPLAGQPTAPADQPKHFRRGHLERARCDIAWPL